MKAYIQYLDYDLVGNLVEPCGDRSVVILDGRNSLATMISDAEMYNGRYRPLYPHYRIMQGNLREAYSIYTSVPNERLGSRSGY